MSSANRTAAIDPDLAAESNTTLFLSIVCAVWSVAFVTALVRFYTRAVLVRSFGKDDIFMVFAVVTAPPSPVAQVRWSLAADGFLRRQICGIGGFISWVVACQHGYGRRQVTIPLPEFVVVLGAQFFQAVIEATFAFGFLKISIALSLLRLSRGTKYKWILWSLIGTV